MGFLRDRAKPTPSDGVDLSDKLNQLQNLIDDAFGVEGPDFAPDTLPPPPRPTASTESTNNPVPPPSEAKPQTQTSQMRFAWQDVELTDTVIEWYEQEAVDEKEPTADENGPDAAAYSAPGDVQWFDPDMSPTDEMPRAQSEDDPAPKDTGEQPDVNRSGKITQNGPETTESDADPAETDIEDIPVLIEAVATGEQPAAGILPANPVVETPPEPPTFVTEPTPEPTESADLADDAIDPELGLELELELEPPPQAPAEPDPEPVPPPALAIGPEPAPLIPELDLQLEPEPEALPPRQDIPVSSPEQVTSPPEKTVTTGKTEATGDTISDDRGELSEADVLAEQLLGTLAERLAESGPGLPPEVSEELRLLMRKSLNKWTAQTEKSLRQRLAQLITDDNKG